MREIEHTDLHPVLRAKSILQFEDLIGLQGTIVSHKGEHLNFVVQDISELNEQVEIYVIEKDVKHKRSLIDTLFSDAVWFPTPRFAALFDAASAERDHRLREAIAHERAEAETAVQARIEAQKVRRAAEWQRTRDLLLDFPAQFERGTAVVTPETLGYISKFRSYMFLKNDDEGRFLRGMINSFDTYGEQTFISDPQAKWIKDILKRSADSLREAQP